MALPEARRDVATAIRDKAKEHAQRNSKDHQLAEVKAVGPLRIQLLDSTISLDEGEFDLSQWATRYDSQWGIDVGDNLVMHRISGYWVAVDVLSDKSMS